MMKIEFSSAGKTVLIRPLGTINLDTVFRMSYAVTDLISAQATHAVFDLGNTEMIMSTAVTFFIQAQDQLTEAGCTLALCNLHRDFISALTVLNVLDHFIITDSLTEALIFTGKRAKDFKPGLPQHTNRSGAESPVEVRVRMDNEVVTELIKHHLPNRLAIDIIDWYVTHNHSIGEPEKIADALSLKTRPVRKMMKELTERHILKEMGGGTFNYGPERDLHLKLKEFFYLWHCPVEHSRIMRIVLTHEL